MEKRMEEANIRFTCIGEVTDAAGGITAVYSDGHCEKIAPPAADELYKVVKR